MTLQERVKELEERVNDLEYIDYVRWNKKLSTKIKMYFSLRRYRDGEDF